MASENTLQQQDPKTNLEQAPTPKLNSDQKAEAGSKDGEGPADSIQKIRKIVETLHEKFPPAPVKPRSHQAKIKRNKSVPVDSSNNDESRKQQGTLSTQTSAPVDSSNNDDSENSIHKLKRNLRLLEEDVAKLRELNEVVGEEVTRHISPLDKLLKKVAKDSTDAKLTKGMKKDLEDINKKIFNLMCQVPLLPNKRRKAGGLDSDAGDVENDGKGIVCLHGIHANENYLKKCEVFRQVRDTFEKLSGTPHLQFCLLSFALFPENQEVNRTMLMYWWMGEGILPDEFKSLEEGILPDKGKPPGKGIPPVKEKPENVVKKILNYFTEKKLIEPVENKRKVEPNSYKMTPFVHSSVVFISKKIRLFDMYPEGGKPRMNKSELNKVCLVEESSSQTEAKAKKMPDAYQIETVFNVSERFPDFTFKWFSEDLPPGEKRFGRLSKNTYKALKVFYLGRWERTAKRHIEVENPELMKFLKHMTKLKLLSFQGISRIERLDEAVCKLRKLIILDLRACYNLEKLPDKIDSLKALIYLDITDCYMIDRMPKRLSWLDNLEVLKGFVVSDATDEETFCMLAELKHLKKLRKLSITINKRDLSVKDLFQAIEGFKVLEKLKVAWGGMNEHSKKEATAGGEQNLIERTATYILRIKAAAAEKDPELSKTLKKLDLQCFPDPELPAWLEPENLVKLEKLYIKGGTGLTGFGKSLPEKPTNCNVKVLRLKFLPRLKVEWRDLSEKYFPNLNFLEKYQCPQVSLCPCDGIGIWRKPEKYQVLTTQN